LPTVTEKPPPRFEDWSVSIDESRVIPPTRDEFVAWINFANAGMLVPQNVSAMRYVLDRISNKPIVEIGSFCGLSTNILAHLVRSRGKSNPIYTCDRWIFEGADSEFVGNSQIKHPEYRQFVMDTFKRNVEFFSAPNKPHPIEALSDEFFERWHANDDATDVFGRDVKLGGPISFCYVDGNHTYECTKRDFENIDRVLEVDGYILFDDSDESDPFGLTSLMQEIAMRGDYQLVARSPNCLFKRIA
jgi:hypothetical protein